MGLRTWLASRIGKGIAKTQLSVFEAFRIKHPDIRNEEIFSKMLRLRPGWSDEHIQELLSEEERQNSLLEFIENVIIYEYMGKLPMNELARAKLGARDFLKKKQKLSYAKKAGVK